MEVPLLLFLLPIVTEERTGRAKDIPVEEIVITRRDNSMSVSESV
jgi:hypothetical protein